VATHIFAAAFSDFTEKKLIKNMPVIDAVRRMFPQAEFIVCANAHFLRRTLINVFKIRNRPQQDYKFSGGCNFSLLYHYS
jgi:hypothetical protein